MNKRRKPAEKKYKRLLLLLLLLLAFIIANIFAGGYATFMQHQRYYEAKVDRLELQMEATRQAYRTNTQELDQRVTALEQKPTYKTVEKKVYVEKETPHTVKERNTIDVPALDPLIPLTGIFTLFGMLKLSSPIGGH